LRETEQRRSLPILALTASATVEDLERARAAGMDGHIAKPVDARRLVSVVAEHVGRPPAGREQLNEGPLGHRPSVAAPAGRPVEARSGADAVVVNLENALTRLQGNADLLTRMIIQFRSEADSARTRLHEAIVQNNREALAYAAHRLRGQAMSLDAEMLAAALGNLERIAAHETPDLWSTSAAALSVVDQEIDRVLESLTHG
jgi:CheY-like chemotaxis protein